MGAGDQIHAPAALPPGKEPVSIVIGGCRWVPGPIWTGAENLAPPTGIQSPDRPAIPAHIQYILNVKQVGCNLSNVIT